MGRSSAPEVQFSAQEAELRREDARILGGSWGSSAAGRGGREVCALGGEESGDGAGVGDRGWCGADDGGAVGVGCWGEREGQGDGGGRRRERGCRRRWDRREGGGGRGREERGWEGGEGGVCGGEEGAEVGKGGGEVGRRRRRRVWVVRRERRCLHASAAEGGEARYWSWAVVLLPSLAGHRRRTRIDVGRELFCVCEMVMMGLIGLFFARGSFISFFFPIIRELRWHGLNRNSNLAFN